MVKLLVKILKIPPVNKSLIIFDGPDFNSNYLNIDTREKFTANSFQVSIIYQNHKDNFEIIFTKDIVENYQSVYKIKEKMQLTSQNLPCSKLLTSTLCTFKLNVSRNYFVNITLLSLQYSGPNVGYCKYGGLSIYDHLHSSIKEVLLLCDNMLTSKFNTQQKQAIVSSTQILSLIFYAYSPYSQIKLNITIQSTKCYGIHLLR